MSGRHGRYSGTIVARADAQPLDRILGALPYILPFVAAWPYGTYLMSDYPVLRELFAPLSPAIASYYNSGQYMPMLIFFALYLGIVKNRQFSSFVRFNTMQALLLDVLLVMPRLVSSLIAFPSMGWGNQVYRFAQSFIWLFITAWVVVAAVTSLMGYCTRIPLVAESAGDQA